MFNLVNQVILREMHTTRFMPISVRAFSYRPDKPTPTADAVLSLAEGIVPRAAMTDLPANVLTALEHDGLNVQLIDGSEQTSGYEVGSTAQALYLNATNNKAFAILWLSPTLRATYRQQSDNQLQAAQFTLFHITSVEQDVGVYLQHQGFSNNTVLDDTFRTLLTQYTHDQNVMRLQQVLDRAKIQGYSLLRLIDRNSKQAFVVCHNSAGKPFALLNLTPKTPAVYYIQMQLPLANQVAEFINQRSTWLIRQTP